MTGMNAMPASTDLGLPNDLGRILLSSLSWSREGKIPHRFSARLKRRPEGSVAIADRDFRKRCFKK